MFKNIKYLATIINKDENWWQISSTKANNNIYKRIIPDIKDNLHIFFLCYPVLYYFLKKCTCKHNVFLIMLEIHETLNLQNTVTAVRTSNPANIYLTNAHLCFYK